MTNNTIHIVYTAAIATELPQLDLEATRTVDLQENLPNSRPFVQLWQRGYRS